MAKKLQPPRLTPLTDKDGNVTDQWLMFFVLIAKQLKINDIHEIGTGAEETNGNWRVKQDGNNLVFQRRESGSWVTKDTITP